MIILKVDLILQDFNTQNRNQEIHFPHNSRPSGSSVTHVRPKNRKTTKKKKRFNQQPNIRHAESLSSLGGSGSGPVLMEAVDVMDRSE